MEEDILDRKNYIYIYVLMIISIIINVFIAPIFSTNYRLLNVLIWILIFFRARKIPNEHNRFKGLKEKLKTIFIIVVIYMICYYLSGLYFGYNQNIYSRTIFGILYNMFFYVSCILFEEYTRSRLINNTRSKFLYILVTIMLIILSFNYNNFESNFATGEIAFKFISSEVYPIVMQQILCSFLVRKGSYKLSLMFLLPQKIFQYITPIVPDLDWFVIVAFESALILLIYYYIYYEHVINISRYTRREIKSANPRTIIPSVLFVILFTFFIAGFFPVQPVALMSNSMKDYIKRGDVVLVKKLKKEQLKNLCVGDVIQYSIEDKTVIHRIVNIYKDSDDGELKFVTQGDANNTPDTYPVEEEQVVGIARYYIPYIGYPSVIFSEKVLKIEDEFTYEGE